MNPVTRFEPSDGQIGIMIEWPFGEYVLFEDYVALLGKLSAASNAHPVNPDATQALVTALRAILEHHYFDSGGIPAGLIINANNALHMAELPVVPVSEDVHLRLGLCRCHDCARARSEDVETIRKELQNDPLWMEFQTNALAALDRLEKGARK